jgi:hypothetical protein
MDTSYSDLVLDVEGMIGLRTTLTAAEFPGLGVGEIRFEPLLHTRSRDGVVIHESVAWGMYKVTTGGERMSGLEPAHA